MALPLVCLFQSSLLVSWFLMPSPEIQGPAEEHAPKTLPAEKREVSTTPDTVQPDPRRGETLLHEGNYALALPHFWPATAAARSALPDTLHYRAALCLEALGCWVEALEAYRVAESKSANERLVTAGQVAQARIYVRLNHAAEAKNLLLPLLLHSGQSDRLEPSLLIEARYLLGLALSQEAFGDQRLPKMEERPVQANSAAWSIGHTLDWLTPATVAKDQAAKLPEVLEVLRQYGPKSEEVLLRGSAKEQASVGLVESLAALGKLNVVWTPQAAQRMQDRQASLAVDGVPLLEVIQSLLDASSLAWQIKETHLHIATDAEMPKEALKDFRATRARQALRQALFAGPDHPLAATAYLELGNDEAVSGKFDEAVSWYQRLLAESSRSPHLSAAYFNLGLVQQARQDFAAAKAFYRVVDRDPGHELAPRASRKLAGPF